MFTTMNHSQRNETSVMITVPVHDPMAVLDGLTLDEVEALAVGRALGVHGWRRGETAIALGISRVALWRRMRAYGIRGPRRQTRHAVAQGAA